LPWFEIWGLRIFCGLSLLKNCDSVQEQALNKNSLKPSIKV